MAKANFESKDLQLRVRSAVARGFSKALTSQDPVARANVARLRRVHPDKSPEELRKYLDKWYLGMVTTSGAAAGASAAVPNMVVQIPVAIAELLAFLELTVMYVLSVSEIHGLHTEDLERRRLLVVSALVGDSLAKSFIEKGVGPVSQHLGGLIVNNISREAIKKINRVIGPRFITITGSKTGTLVLSKQVPLLLGAVFGAAGNHVFARLTVKATKKIVGPTPTNWDHLA